MNVIAFDKRSRLPLFSYLVCLSILLEDCRDVMSSCHAFMAHTKKKKM